MHIYTRSRLPQLSSAQSVCCFFKKKILMLSPPSPDTIDLSKSKSKMLSLSLSQAPSMYARYFCGGGIQDFSSDTIAQEKKIRTQSLSLSISLPLIHTHTHTHTHRQTDRQSQKSVLRLDAQQHSLRAI